MARRVSHLPKRRRLEDYATAGTRAVSSVVLVEARARPGGATEAAWLAERGRTRSTRSVAGIVASLPVERGNDVVAELEKLLEAVGSSRAARSAVRSLHVLADAGR